MDRMTFTDKAVLVTGGATGIGRAACVALAGAGAKVIIGDIDPRAEEMLAAASVAYGQAVREERAARRSEIARRDERAPQQRVLVDGVCALCGDESEALVCEGCRVAVSRAAE